VPPFADHLDDRRVWVQFPDLAIERARLGSLIDDHAIAGAPPDLERNAGEGDLAGEVERAPDCVRARIGEGRAADLGPRKRL